MALRASSTAFAPISSKGSRTVVSAGVKAPLLAMEEGVVFNGTLEMSQSATREPQGTSRGQGVKLVNS